MSGLTRLDVKNYRSLAEVSVQFGPVNVLFGPNGAGKSTFLDTMWFFRDCAIRGVDEASSDRSHGIGILWDGADDDEQISLCLATDEVEYELSLGFSSGRIEPFAGERLSSKRHAATLIGRTVGTDRAALFSTAIGQHETITLREPEKICLSRYLDHDPQNDGASTLDGLLHSIRFYHGRSFILNRLKRQGSEGSHETRLWDRGDNAWSVLRNLHDRRSVDERYDTIMRYMTESFPTFDGLLLEQTGPSSVYASFREKGRRKEIQASGASDGHLQMLLLLTALFSEGPREAVLLFDEPEISLHPWALAVLAKAVRAAAEQWQKQVLIATHSPVLLSQFDPEQILAMEVEGGRTRSRRLSEIHEIRDLLEEYGAGSLYMAEMVAPQSELALEQGGD